MIAELTARGPDALWGRLHDGVGGPLARLPQTAAGALATSTRLDLTLAGEIDGAAPAYAVVASSGGSFGWVIALGLRDFEQAHTALLEGKSPRFAGRDTDGGLTRLTPARDAATAGLSIALSPLGYLILASTPADLASLAPYATRTLPSRPKSTHALVVSVTHAALAGPLHDRLAAQVAELRASATKLDLSLRAEHGGKAPDLGDPAVVIQALDDAARDRLALLADLATADITLDAGEDDVVVEVRLTPGPGPSARAFAGLVTGDATPLLTLSADTDAALLFRDDPTSMHKRADAIADRAAAVLKPALSEKDAKALRAALEGWAGSRGPWLTAALELEGAPAITLRTPAADPDRATRAFGGLVALAELPVFRAMLEARLSVKGSSIASATTGPAGGTTSIATFRRSDAHGSAASEVAVAWAATGDLLHVATATSSARALRASKDPQSLLGMDIRLAGKLGTLQDRASFVFAGRRSPESAGEAAPSPSARRKDSVVVAIGGETAREKSFGWGMLEVDDELVRDGLARWLEQ